MRDAWECCAALFSLGNLERLHAYSVLALSLSFFSKSATDGGNLEEFAIVHKKEFWQEIHKGLVHYSVLIFGLFVILLAIFAVASS